MSIIRAQVILHTFDNLPENFCTNTFHFETVAGLTDPLAGEIVSDLASFYSSLRVWFSPVLNLEVEIKLFNLDDPTPRQPYNPGWSFMSAGWGSGGAPEEVACVMSIHASLPHTARRRGRVYLGPLVTGAVTGGSTTDFAKFSTTFVTAVKDAGDNMVASTSTPVWVVYSPTDDVGRAVTGGFVDNSPDTQRRRGHVATSRQLFGVD